MSTQTFAIFMKGYCGAQTFALDGGWESITQFQKEMGLTDDQIKDNWFEIDQWPIEFPRLRETPTLEEIDVVMVMGNPSRAYINKAHAQVKDALALVSESEYETLL